MWPAGLKCDRAADLPDKVLIAQDAHAQVSFRLATASAAAAPATGQRVFEHGDVGDVPGKQDGH